MSENTGHSPVKIGSDRNFGFVMAGAFAIIGLLPLIHGGNVRIWCFIVSALFLAPALVYPRILHPLNILWLRFGLLLGRIIAPIVMTALFLLTFTPMAFILRLLGKDPLRRRMDPEAQSYWIPRNDEGGKMGSMKNQF